MRKKILRKNNNIGMIILFGLIGISFLFASGSEAAFTEQSSVVSSNYSIQKYQTQTFDIDDGSCLDGVDGGTDCHCNLLMEEDCVSSGSIMDISLCRYTMIDYNGVYESPTDEQLAGCTGTLENRRSCPVDTCTGTYIGDWPWKVNANTNVNHIVRMTPPASSIRVNDAMNFTYVPYDPNVFGVGGWIDTPYGAWCNDLSSPCVTEKSLWFEMDDDPDGLIYTFLTAVKPSGVYIIGDEQANSPNYGNPVVSCSGMSCTAKRIGTTTVRAVIPQTQAKGWAYCTMRNPRSISRCTGSAAAALSEDVTFGSTTIPFDITVTDQSGSFMLTVNKTPGDVGIVSSSSYNPSAPPDSQIYCDNNGCTQDTATYNSGQVVTLHATHGTGVSVSWSGCVANGDDCTVTMDASKTVAVNFVPEVIPDTCPLNVSVTGQGRVTGGGIYCTSTGGTCSYNYSPSESVTLKASPNIGADFSGWGGVCSTSGTNLSCGVTMGTGENCGRNASATFTTIPCTGYVCDPCGEDQCGYVTDLKCYDCNNNEVDQSYCPNSCYTNCGSCQSGRWREVVPE